MVKQRVQTYLAASLQNPVNRVFGFEKDKLLISFQKVCISLRILNPGNRKSEAVKI